MGELTFSGQSDSPTGFVVPTSIHYVAHVLIKRTAAVCFQQKIIFLMQNLEIWGLIGAEVKNFCRRWHIWNHRPQCAYSL